MIIPCFRCGKEIDTPDDKNADYIMAEDTIKKEPREVFVALKHNQTTLTKVADVIKQWRIKQQQIIEEAQLAPDILPEDKPSDLSPDAKPTKDFIYNQLQDSEYDAVEVINVAAAQRQFGEDLVKVIAEVRQKDIQKTGVICPECYKLTDTVIWGIHKVEALEKK